MPTFTRTSDVDGVRSTTTWDETTGKLVKSIDEYESGKGLAGLKTRTTTVRANGSHEIVSLYQDGSRETRVKSAAEVQREVSSDVPPPRQLSDREIRGCYARSFRPAFG